MRTKPQSISIALVFLVTVVVAAGLMLVGGEASKWAKVVLPVGLITGGLLVLLYPRRTG